MADLKIFTYLPNPRMYKSTTAARFAGVDVEVLGVPANEIAGWLWDFDARPLTDAEQAGSDENVRQGRKGFSGKLRKTDAFMAANPFGTVPVSFSPDGLTGIFESNSIMRTVARLGGEDCTLYGTNAYDASRIDSFLDAGLVFGRDTQDYLLSLMSNEPESISHGRAQSAFDTYMTGINQAMQHGGSYLLGEAVTLADICFIAEVALFSNEIASHPSIEAAELAPVFTGDTSEQFPHAWALFERLREHEHFVPDFGKYLAKRLPAAA